MNKKTEKAVRSLMKSGKSPKAIMEAVTDLIEKTSGSNIADKVMADKVTKGTSAGIFEELASLPDSIWQGSHIGKFLKKKAHIGGLAGIASVMNENEEGLTPYLFGPTDMEGAAIKAVVQEIPPQHKFAMLLYTLKHHPKLADKVFNHTDWDRLYRSDFVSMVSDKDEAVAVLSRSLMESNLPADKVAKIGVAACLRGVFSNNPKQLMLPTEAAPLALAEILKNKQYDSSIGRTIGAILANNDLSADDVSEAFKQYIADDYIGSPESKMGRAKDMGLLSDGKYHTPALELLADALAVNLDGSTDPRLFTESIIEGLDKSNVGAVMELLCEKQAITPSTADALTRRMYQNPGIAEESSPLSVGYVLQNAPRELLYQAGSHLSEVVRAEVLKTNSAIRQLPEYFGFLSNLEDKLGEIIEGLDPYQTSSFAGEIYQSFSPELADLVIEKISKSDEGDYLPKASLVAKNLLESDVVAARIPSSLVSSIPMDPHINMDVADVLLGSEDRRLFKAVVDSNQIHIDNRLIGKVVRAALKDEQLADFLENSKMSRNASFLDKLSGSFGDDEIGPQAINLFGRSVSKMLEGGNSAEAYSILSNPNVLSSVAELASVGDPATAEAFDNLPATINKAFRGMPDIADMAKKTLWKHDIDLTWAKPEILTKLLPRDIDEETARGIKSGVGNLIGQIDLTNVSDYSLSKLVSEYVGDDHDHMHDLSDGIESEIEMLPENLRRAASRVGSNSIIHKIIDKADFSGDNGAEQFARLLSMVDKSDDGRERSLASDKLLNRVYDQFKESGVTKSLANSMELIHEVCQSTKSSDAKRNIISALTSKQGLEMMSQSTTRQLNGKATAANLPYFQKPAVDGLPSDIKSNIVRSVVEGADAESVGSIADAKKYVNKYKTLVRDLTKTFGSRKVTDYMIKIPNVLTKLKEGGVEFGSSDVAPLLKKDIKLTTEAMVYGGASNSAVNVFKNSIHALGSEYGIKLEDTNLLSLLNVDGIKRSGQSKASPESDALADLVGQADGYDEDGYINVNIADKNVYKYVNPSIITEGKVFFDDIAMSERMAREALDNHNYCVDTDSKGNRNFSLKLHQNQIDEMRDARVLDTFLKVVRSRPKEVGHDQIGWSTVDPTGAIIDKGSVFSKENVDKVSSRNPHEGGKLAKVASILRGGYETMDDRIESHTNNITGGPEL